VSDPYYVVDRQERAGVEVLRLSGDLDINARADITDAICAAATTGRPIEVDLAEVGFLDSSALGVLISGLNHAHKEGRGFTVVNPSPAAQRLLAVTGLDEVLAPR
jgi:anti-sigma B factor antagonist